MSRMTKSGHFNRPLIVGCMNRKTDAVFLLLAWVQDVHIPAELRNHDILCFPCGAASQREP